MEGAPSMEAGEVQAFVGGTGEAGAEAVHGSTSPRSRSFSASLAKNTSRCFKCQSQGNHLDLRAAATGQSIYDAAIDLSDRLKVELSRIPFIQHGPPTRGTRNLRKKLQQKNGVITTDAY